MKGDPEILKALNGLLSDELAAVNQYVVHAEMSENWKYSRFAAYVMGRAKGEMGHAEKLIARIVFLEGVPDVATLGPINIGSTIPAMLQNDAGAEMRAIAKYNEAIATAAKAGDSATREMLEHLLVDEDRHINEIEGLLTQVQQMGMQNFLAGQV